MPRGATQAQIAVAAGSSYEEGASILLLWAPIHMALLLTNLPVAPTAATGKILSTFISHACCSAQAQLTLEALLSLGWSLTCLFQNSSVPSGPMFWNT